MVLNASLAGQTLVIPGAYSNTKVALAGSRSFLPTGRIAIVGESTGGPPGSGSGVLKFNASDLSGLIQTFKGGRIVEAARVLVGPSNDARIANGASEILVYQTNANTQASLSLLTSFGDLESKGYGIEENLLASEIEKIDASLGSVSSSSPFDSTSVFTAADTFVLRELGGIVNTFAVPVGNITTRAELTTELADVGNWSAGLPGDVEFTVGGVADATTTLEISVKADTSDHKLGAGRVFELVDGIGGMLAYMNVPVGLVENTSEPKVHLKITRSLDDVDEDSDDVDGDVGGQFYMELGYEGDTAEVTIDGNTLVTVVTGGSGSALNVPFSSFSRLGDLVDFINSQIGYTCTLDSILNPAVSPTELDRVVSLGICSSASGLTPGKIKADSYEIQKYFNANSSVVDLARSSYLGLPDALVKSFLSGGTLGASSNSNFTAGLIALEAEEFDIVVPLVSQDATDDLAEDSSSTAAASVYTVESIITAVKNHCKKMGSIKNKKERQSYSGYRGTFEECQNFSRTLNSELLSMCIQDTYVVSSAGNLEWMQPWMAGCFMAGMQAGGSIGQPTTRKYIAANGVKHVKKQGLTPSSLEEFKPLSKAETAIKSGIAPLLAPSEGGVRIMVQNATYSKDANFVFNRPSVLEASFFVAKNLRKQLEDTFVGTKNKGISSKEVIRSFITGVMADFLKAEIIVGDDSNDGLGYKNLVISITGNTVTIQITTTPVQGIDFILNEIVLDTIRVAA